MTYIWHIWNDMESTEYNMNEKNNIRYKGIVLIFETPAPSHCSHGRKYKKSQIEPRVSHELFMTKGSYLLGN